MNLIEYLGLDFAKQIHRENLEEFLGDATGVTVVAKGIEFKHEELSEALLQYRREHNIFEVGDKVVLLNWDNNNRLLTIKRVYEHKINADGEYSYSTFIYYVYEWSHDHAFSKRDIRHATPQEIQAGKRNV